MPYEFHANQNTLNMTKIVSQVLVGIIKATMMLIKKTTVQGITGYGLHHVSFMQIRI